MQRYRIGIIVGLWGGVAACGLIADLGPPPDVVTPSDGSVDATGEAAIPPDVVSRGDGSLDAQDGSPDAQDGSPDAQDAPDADLDASIDADVASEAAPLPVPPDASCNADAPFGDPVSVPLPTGGPENFDARLTIDELTVYFASDTTQGAPDTLRIWSATRAHFIDSFGTPAPVYPGSVMAQYAPSVTEDGLSMYMNVYNSSVGNSEIYVSTRSGPLMPYGAANLVSSFDAGADYANPMITPDGSTLYFFVPTTKNTIPTRGFIYTSSRGADGGFGLPEGIDEINGGGDAENLAVSADQRILVFSTVRSDTSKQNLDIWISSRAKASDAWGPPASLPANINSPAAEAPTWISGDGCRLYFQSNRTGNNALYLATRPQ
jgi:hypothetical protein